MFGRTHHITCGDPAHNLLNHSGLQLFALDGAGAVRFKVAMCVERAYNPTLIFRIVTMHNSDTTEGEPQIDLQTSCITRNGERLPLSPVTALSQPLLLHNVCCYMQ